MKLYVFRPDGHGGETFAVIEESKEKALENIIEHMDKHYICTTKELLMSDYYTLEVYEQGQVMVNDND